MHTTRGPRSIIATLAATVLVATACGSPAATPSTPTPTSGEETRTPEQSPEPTLAEQLTIGQPASLQFVDPQRTYLSTEAGIWHSLYDSLAFRLPDMEIAPGLAKSWEMISDTEWQLELQEGVTFHNGEAFNAEVVKWNVERVIVPGFQDFPYLSALTGAEVIDEHTVVIQTNDLLPTFPGLLAQFTIIPPDYMEEVGIEGFNDAPVGTGPYRFVEWVRDSHITLEANPDYWSDAKAPTYQRVTWQFIPEAGSAVAALRAGEIDILKDLPPDDFDPVDAEPDLEATWVRSLRTVFFRFFPDTPVGGGEPLEDVRVRRALNHAIDVDAMMQGLLGGRGFRTATLMTPDFPGYDESVEPYEYDPELARELLEEAGYPDGFDMVFDTWSAGPAPRPIDLAQVAASNLEEVGITTEIVPVDIGSALDKQNERTLPPIHLWSWGAGQVDCRDKFWGVFSPESTSTFLTDDTTSELIEELDRTVDQEARDALCSDLQHRVHDQAFIVALFAQPDLYGKRAEIEWQPRPDELILPWEVSPAQ